MIANVDPNASWRAARRDIEDHMFWIDAHRRVLNAGQERPEYLAYAEKRLSDHLVGYLRCVRTITETES